MTVRPATESDVPELLAMVRELAEYERALEQVQAGPAQLAEHLFGPDAVARAHVAVDDDGAVVGMAVWYRTYSTWTGVPGLHLEDLYVRPAARRGGHGRALLAALAQVCAERGWRRLQLEVLDWNAPAIGFYRAVGARPHSGWTTFRWQDEKVALLAAGAAPAGASGEATVRAVP